MLVWPVHCPECLGGGWWQVVICLRGAAVPCSLIQEFKNLNGIDIDKILLLLQD